MKPFGVMPRRVFQCPQRGKKNILVRFHCMVSNRIAGYVRNFLRVCGIDLSKAVRYTPPCSSTDSRICHSCWDLSELWIIPYKLSPSMTSALSDARGTVVAGIQLPTTK